MLRAEARARVITQLARALDVWRRPRRTAYGESSKRPARGDRFHARNRARRTHAWARRWNGEALRRLAARELAARRRPIARPGTTYAVVLAGSIPMPALLTALVAPLALGTPVLGQDRRRATRSPHELVARSIAARIDADLKRLRRTGAAREHGRRAHWTTCSRHDCVVVTGSTTRRVATLSERPAPTLVAHGHRLSIAVLGPDACEGGAAATRCGRGPRRGHRALGSAGVPVADRGLYAVERMPPRPSALPTRWRARSTTRRALAARRGRACGHGCSVRDERAGRSCAAPRARGAAVYAAPTGAWCVVP